MRRWEYVTVALMTPDALFSAVAEFATLWINTIARQVERLPVSYAFGAGMLASVNPCGFIMLPAFAAFFVSGTEREDTSFALRLGRAAWLGVLVTVAFIVTFTAAGAVIAAGGRALMAWSAWAGLLAGVVLIGIALLQLFGRSVMFPGFAARIRIRRERSPRGALLFGMGYAVCSLGCTLPAFMVVAAAVFVGNRDYLESMVRFIEYGLGMGSVLTVVIVALTVTRVGTSRWITRFGAVGEIAASVMLLFAGAYVVWYWSSSGQL